MFEDWINMSCLRSAVSGMGKLFGNCCGPGLSFVPLCFVVLTLVTFITTYTVAVLNGHMRPFLPYVSDTGGTPPESCIFGQCLNISAFLSLFIIYFRYKIIEEFHGEDRKLRLGNKVSFGFGTVGALGITIVANFQAPNALIIHMTGSFLMFACCWVYACIQTHLSYKMYPDRCGISVCRVRLAIVSLSVCLGLTALGSLAISMSQRSPEADTSTLFWGPDEPGFVAHVTSAACEWVTCPLCVLFFATFIPEFKTISLDVKIVKLCDAYMELS